MKGNPFSKGTSHLIFLAYPLILLLSSQLALAGVVKRGEGSVVPTSTAWNVRLASHWGYGKYSSLKARSDTVFVLSGSMLVVLDFSHPSNPHEFGAVLLPAPGRSIALRGGLAAVAAGDSGVALVDISDPREMRVLGVCPLSGPANDVDISGDLAFASAASEGLWIVDASDPSLPVVMGHLETTRDAVVVEAGADRVFVGQHNGRVDVVDVSDPSAPIRRADAYLHGNVSDLLYADGLLYAGSWDDGEFSIFDVSSGWEPNKIGYFSQDEELRRFDLAGGYVYAGDLGGVSVFDVHDPTNPRRVAFYNELYTIKQVSVSGPYAYALSEEFGIFALDISDPPNPVNVGRYIGGGSNRAVKVQGSYAFLANGGSDLQVIDVSDPASPSRVSSWAIDPLPYDYANDIDVRGRYAFLSKAVSGLIVIDVLDPRHPRRVGGSTQSADLRGTTAHGHLAYGSYPDAGIAGADHPSPPSTSIAVAGEEKNGARLPYRSARHKNVTSTVLIGNYAYTAVPDFGLRIFDMTDPSNPVEVGWYRTQGSPVDIEVFGKYVYLADGTDGLYILEPTVFPGPREEVPLLREYLPICDEDSLMKGALVYSSVAVHVEAPTQKRLFLSGRQGVPDSLVVGGSVILNGVTVIGGDDPEDPASFLSGPSHRRTPRTYPPVDITHLIADRGGSCLLETVVGDDQCQGHADIYLVEQSLTDLDIALFQGSITTTGVELQWCLNDYLRARTITLFRRESGMWAPIVEIDCNSSCDEYTDSEVIPGSSYTYRLAVATEGGRTVTSSELRVKVPPVRPELGQNYPNPFSSSTTIAFIIPREARVDLSIYDVAGRRVKSLYRGRARAGQSAYTWDGTDEQGAKVASGVYLCRLRVGEYSFSRRIALMR